MMMHTHKVLKKGGGNSQKQGYAFVHTKQINA